MASRQLGDLHPLTRQMAELAIHYCRENGVNLLVYMTKRSNREQAMLFRRGHSLSQVLAKADELTTVWKRPDLARILIDVGPQYGKFVTRAGPGQSMHNYGHALDVVARDDDGNLIWDDDAPQWRVIGQAAHECGLKWGGNFGEVPGQGWDKPHLENPDYSWKTLIKIKPLTGRRKNA